MSNGLCSDSCRGSYVFAVLLGKSCWCSNYVPATQESTSQCSDACPGYPSDTCGNSAQGLYAYIQLGGTPSGTAGASSASSSSIPSPSVSTTVPTTSTGSSSNGRPSRTVTFSTFSASVLTSSVSSQSSAEPSTQSLSFFSTVSESDSATTPSSSPV